MKARKHQKAPHTVNCAGNEDVEPTQLPDGGFHGLVDSLLVGHIANQFQATATQRLQLQCPGAPKAWPTQVEQRHIGPFRCQGAGTGPADSTRRPGDQSPLSLQPHDRLSLAIPPKPSKFRPTCPTRGVLAAYGLGL